MEPQRDDDGRFAAGQPLGPLLDLIAQTARSAVGSPEDPAGVSMRRFNALRPDGVPTAEAIHLRFNQRAARPASWRAIVELALLNGRARSQRFAGLIKVPQVDDLDDRRLHYALHRAAQHLGTAAFGPDRYDHAWEEIRRAGPAPEVPTSGQIITARDSWPAAMRSVGLRPPSRTGQRRRPAHVPQPSRRGTRIVDVIVSFAKVNGPLPGQHVAERYARACEHRMQQQAPQSWVSYLDDAERILAADGVTGLARPRRGKPRRGEHPNEFQVPADGIIEGGIRRDQAVEPSWDKAMCLNALAEYAAECDTAGREPRQRHYTIVRTGRPWPALTTLQRNCDEPFQDLIAQARALARHPS